MDQAAEDMQNLLYTIPNVPFYESVPEGTGAEDNMVEKMGGMETELPKAHCLTGNWLRSMI